MSSLEAIRSQFKAEFGGRVLSLVATGILTIALARLLSPDGYGLLYLALSVFGLFEFLSKMGIGNAAARYVAEYRVTDPGQIPHVVRLSLLYTLVATAATVAGVLFFREEIAAVIGEADLVPFLLVGSLFLVGTTAMGYVRTLLQGFEEIRYSAVLVAASSACKLAFALGLVLLGYGALGALVGHAVALVLASCLGAALLYRVVRSYDAADRPEAGLGGRILRYNVPILFTRGSNVLDKRVDTILVGVFLTPVAVSYYVVSKQIVGFLQAPAAALGFTISPTFGNQKADGNLVEAARMYESTLIYVLLLYLPAAAGIAITAEPAIAYTFGTDYLGAVPVLQVLSLFVVLQALMQVTSTALDFLGRARMRAIAKGTTAVGNVCLNVLLIPEFGVVGAAVATAITYSVYAVVNVYVITTEFPLRRGYVVRRTVTILAITAAMSFVVLSLLAYVTNVVSLVALAALGAAIWFALSMLTGLIEWNDVAAAV